MRFEDLTPEQKEKAKNCKTIEDLLALAKDEGYTLTEEEIDAISGGGGWGFICVPKSCTLHAMH